MRIFFGDGGTHINTLSTSTSMDGYPGFIGMTPLLIYADGGQVTTTGLSWLLRQGADVRARDPRGRTCLHFLLHVYSGAYPERWTAGNRIILRDVCETLVRSGADVNAVDNLGRSVSEVAYDYRHHRHPYVNWSGSFFGDMWDRVLAGAGLDVASYRNKHGLPRRAKYVERYYYTRKDFEEMWEGKTELCPYYHDAESSDAESPSDVLSGSDSEFSLDEYEWPSDQSSYDECNDDESRSRNEENASGAKEAQKTNHTGTLEEEDNLFLASKKEPDDREEGWDSEGDISEDSSDADSDGGCRLE